MGSASECEVTRDIKSLQPGVRDYSLKEGNGQNIVDVYVQSFEQGQQGEKSRELTKRSSNVYTPQVVPKKATRVMNTMGIREAKHNEHSLVLPTPQEPRSNVFKFHIGCSHIIIPSTSDRRPSGPKLGFLLKSKR